MIEPRKFDNNGEVDRVTNRIDGFIIDFYCKQVKLAVEVDGEIHKLRSEYDQDREEILQSRGLRILKATNGEIDQDIEAVLQRILAFCKQG